MSSARTPEQDRVLKLIPDWAVNRNNPRFNPHLHHFFRMLYLYKLEPNILKMVEAEIRGEKARLEKEAEERRFQRILEGS